MQVEGGNTRRVDSCPKASKSFFFCKGQPVFAHLVFVGQIGSKADEHCHIRTLNYVFRVVKCLWEVFVWGFLLVARVCVPVSGVFSLSVCPVCV